jgi:dTDP-4-amino-4,6-dideoxygalactose transaminase
MEALDVQGVQTGIHYPVPVHLLPAYSDLNYHAGDFPIAERLASEELSLPMFPELTESQIDAVASAIEEYSSVCQS